MHRKYMIFINFRLRTQSSPPWMMTIYKTDHNKFILNKKINEINKIGMSIKLSIDLVQIYFLGFNFSEAKYAAFINFLL